MYVKTNLAALAGATESPNQYGPHGRYNRANSEDASTPSMNLLDQNRNLADEQALDDKMSQDQAPPIDIDDNG